MGWIEDCDRLLRYVCPDGHKSFYEVKASEFNNDPRPCHHCDKEATYEGMGPLQSNLFTKVMYEKNGRLAYRYSDGKGGVSHMSKTKYDYLETGKIKNQYTPEFRQHLADKGRYDLLVSDTTTRERMKNVKIEKALKVKGDNHED